jgi:hypothetical protein
VGEFTEPVNSPAAGNSPSTPPPPIIPEFFFLFESFIGGVFYANVIAEPL